MFFSFTTIAKTVSSTKVTLRFRLTRPLLDNLPLSENKKRYRKILRPRVYVITSTRTNMGNKWVRNYSALLTQKRNVVSVWKFCLKWKKNVGTNRARGCYRIGGAIVFRLLLRRRALGSVCHCDFAYRTRTMREQKHVYGRLPAKNKRAKNTRITDDRTQRARPEEN